MSLPRPSCKYGYPRSQVVRIVASYGRSFKEFERWMRGQTMTLCDGQRYSHERKQYEPTNCGPHGPVVYAHDLQRFLRNQEPFD